MELDQKKEDIKKYDDTKIITAIVCLFIGFLFVWNIAARASAVYELHLDAETCDQVKTLGLVPADNCVITASYRPFEIAPSGYLTLPNGNDIQIVPVTANRTNQGVEWSTSMKLQFWVALLFWAATMGLLISAFQGKKESK